MFLVYSHSINAGNAFAETASRIVLIPEFPGTSYSLTPSILTNG